MGMSFNKCHKKRCAINTKSSLANCTCGFTANFRKRTIDDLRTKLDREKEDIAKVREVACKKAQEILDLRQKLADEQKNHETTEAFGILRIEELQAENKRLKEEKLTLYRNIRNLGDENRELCSLVTAKDKKLAEAEKLIKDYATMEAFGLLIAEAKMINGIKGVHKLQADIIGAYNRGYIKGLVEGRE